MPATCTEMLQPDMGHWVTSVLLGDAAAALAALSELTAWAEALHMTYA